MEGKTKTNVNEETHRAPEPKRRHLQSTALFAANLKFLLNRNGMTAKQLSKEIGVSEQSISGWMTNVRSPRASMIEDIARYFGVRAIDMQDPLGNAGLIPDHDISVKVPMVNAGNGDSASFVPAGSKTRLTSAMISTDDDMYPLIKSGDIVLYTEARPPYREGSLVVVRRKDASMTIRRIYISESDSTFTLAADGNIRPETYHTDRLKEIVAGRPVFVQRNIENA